jgi:hypothetical protein
MEVPENHNQKLEFPTKVVVAAVAKTTTAVTLAVAAVMVMAEVKVTTMAVALSAVSDGGNDSNGTTMGVCNAILLRYADIVNVGSNDDGDCAPTIDRGNIDRWVADFDNGVQCAWGG